MSVLGIKGERNSGMDLRTNNSNSCLLILSYGCIGSIKYCKILSRPTRFR